MASPHLLVDSHCHIDFPEFSDDLEKVLERAAENRVAYLLCVSVDLENFYRIEALTRAHNHIFSTIGVHPNSDCLRTGESLYRDLVEGSRGRGVVGIGETGLDYFRSKGDLGWQKDRFRVHIRAAKKAQMPLIVHSRNAKDDTISILKEEGGDEYGGVMHCFTGDWEMARAALDLGFFISFSGIITFRNALDLQSVVRRVPRERLLVETDAPYLSPVPMRGKRNEPAYVRYTAERLAELRGEPVEQLAHRMTKNFFELFGMATETKNEHQSGILT